MKPTQQLIDNCKKEGIDPECLDHMLFEGKYGPNVMDAHFQEAIGKLKFKNPCSICDKNRHRWLRSIPR